MDQDNIPKSRAVDLAFKIMSTLIIPVFGWVLRLEVTNAIQSERIAELQADMQKASTVSVTVQQNTTALVKLEAKLDGLGKDLNEIKKILDR